MKIQDYILLVIIFISIGLNPVYVFAHPGRTDSSGCHTCRTNCSSWGLSYGEYHCHRSKSLPQPEEPIRSHYGENGTGTTEPWPEYKSPSIPIPSPSPTASISTLKSISNTSVITYTLAKGMQNNQVTKLQQILARYPEIYPEGLITGYFGTITERAVGRFQKKYNLEQVGSVGPKTRAILNSL